MKRVLITGAAGPLGQAIVKELEGEYLLEKHYYQNALEGGVFGDFSTAKTLASFLKAYQAKCSDTYALIHTVGLYEEGSALESSPELWERMLWSNLLVAQRLCQALLPQIIAQKGSIIQIGVVGIAAMRASQFASAYHAAKTALWSYTLGLANEVKAEGVRANMLSPAYLENSKTLPKDPQQLLQSKLCSLPEFAKAVHFLLDQNYITGQNIEIAGGYKL